MADESSPIWFDVGMNLNAVSFVIGLQWFTKGRTTRSPHSKQLIQICSRKLICYEAVDVKENAHALKNTVHFPGIHVNVSIHLIFWENFRLKGKMWKKE